MKNLLFLFVLIVMSCNPIKKEQKVSFKGQTQGTFYTITYFHTEGKNFQKEIDSILLDFEQSLSLYSDSSIISLFNQSDSSILADEYFIEVFKTAKKVYQSTNGYFDPTIGPIVNAWGFGSKKIREADSSIIDTLMKSIGFDQVIEKNGQIIKLRPGIKLDFNAIAQGYTVDVVADFMIQNGVENYLIEIGGEVRAEGLKENNTPWKIGIEKPAQNSNAPQTLKATLTLKNRSMATSGNYRKFFMQNGVKYSHTIDPKTGYPAKNTLLSVTVLAETCIIADAYATAFMVMGLDRSKEFLNKHQNLEAYFIYSDKEGKYKTYMTEGIKENITEIE